MKRKVWNKIQWDESMIQYLKKNYRQKSNKELASDLGLKLTVLRIKLYELGLKRMELEYWEPRQITYLKRNFRRIGDVEIAERFNRLWPKKKGWTNKHIEKKRKYLKLVRTAAEIEKIKQRNIDTGRFSECAVKRWKVSQQAPIGEIRIWQNIPVIKTESGWRHYARWLYENKNGKIRKGFVIRIVDPLKPITIDNLVKLSRKQNASINSKNRNLYPEELKKAIKLINQLNNKVYGKEQTNRSE